MRIIILSIALLFCAFSAHSQVLKSAGVWYFLDVDSLNNRPAQLPNGTELAYVIGTRTLYKWNRGSSAWEINSNGGLTMPFDSIYFTPSSVDPDTAELKYSADLETFVFGADGTTIEIGQKTAWYVKNQTGSTIAKGTVVRASGTLGSSGRILISPMAIDGTVESRYLLGVTASDIPTGSDGYVIHFGKLRKFNTSGFTAGSVLYAGTGGTLTATEPSPPNLRLPIAFVVHSHATNGVLAIRVQTGNELHELHDVDTTGIQNNGLLTWNSSSQKWQAAAPDNDKSSTNELQNLSFAQPNLFISGGNFVDLSPLISGMTTTAGGVTNRVPIWLTSTTLGSSNFQDNNTAISILNNKPFQFGTWTTAGRPTGVTGYWGYNTTDNGPEWYQGARWAKVLESTANRFPVGQIIHTDANQQATGSSTFTQIANKLTLGVPSGKNPIVDIVTGSGDGTVNEAAGLRLRNRDIDGNTFYLQLGTSTASRGGANQGHAYIQSGLWGGSYNNPFILMPKGGNIGIGATRPINWELSVTSNIAVSAALASTPTSNTLGGRIVFNAGTVAGTIYNSAPASIASVFDNAFWYQGAGLTFRTISGSDISGHTAGGIERMRISSDGKVGIGTSNPEFAMLRIRDSLGVASRIVTETAGNFVTVAAGSSGNPPALMFQNNQDFRIATATNYYGVGFDAQWIFGTTGTLRMRRYGVDAMQANNLSKTLGGLAAFANDGTMLDYKLSSVWKDYQTDKAILGADSSFTHDPGQDTTFVGGTQVFGKQSTLGRQGVSGYPFVFRNPSTASTYLLVESGRTSPTGGEAGIRFLPSGIWSASLEFGSSTSKSLQFYNYNISRPVMILGSSGFVSGNSRTVIVGHIDDPSQWSGNGSLVVYDTITSGKALILAKKVSSSSTPIAMFSSSTNDRFTFNDDGTTRFHTYATAATTAAALSKTQSNYAAGFATDGTVTSLEVKRDTTVYIVDADMDWSAAITTAQISRRYNRVIFLMTTTGAAGSDSELTLHTPDVNLMQVEYLVRSTDEAGGFTNVIRFGTNNAVDSTNGLVSSYFPAAGQGVGIRAGLRSGVYKYFYY